MCHQPADRDPDMAIQEFRTRWSGCGIMVRPGQFDFGPVTLCGRIIQCQFDELTDVADRNLFDSQMQQFGGDTFCAASQCLKEVIVILPVIRHTSGPQPACHCSAAASKQHAENDSEKIFSASSIQSGGENLTPVCYPVGQRPCSHRGAPSGKELSS